MERRKALGLMTASALGALAGRAAGQDRQGMIRIVVPYAAGGQTDSMARLMSESMQKTLGRTIIVDNRPGAAGLIATKNVQRAPPDGLASANSGINSAGHISSLMFEKLAGIKLVHVPYKGSAEVTRALLA